MGFLRLAVAESSNGAASAMSATRPSGFCRAPSTASLCMARVSLMASLCACLCCPSRSILCSSKGSKSKHPVPFWVFMFEWTNQYEIIRRVLNSSQASCNHSCLVPVIVYNVLRGHIPHCSVNHTDKPFLLSGSSRIQRPQALQLGGDHLYCIESRTTRDGGEMEEPILGWSWGITTLCPRALGSLHCRGLQRLGSWHGPSL